MKSQPSKAKGVENAARLDTWIRETPATLIPVNQFGKAARQKICAELGISRSTVSSNPAVKGLFDKLDLVLFKKKIPDAHTSSSRSKVAQKNVVIALQASNSRLISERSELEAQVVGLKYLQDTGGFLSALLKSEK